MTLPDQPQENRRLLAVDDDSMILALYQKLFVDGEAVDSSSRVGSTLLELTSIVSEVVTESATEAAVSCQRYPYQLTLCSQGGEAVEVVRKAVVAGEPYAVALIDMRMPPGIDGLETARQIRQLDKSLQLIFITAYSDHTIDNICDDVGGQILFFHKPLQTEELYQTVRNSCWSWNQSHELSQLKSDLEARIELQTEQLRDRIRSTDLLHQSAVTREQRISILTHRNRHLQAYQDLHQILSVELLPEPKTGQQLAEAIEQAEGTVSLLLVDESATTQEIYRSGLETMGFAVRGVGDIESAMVAALENPPELALINYHLSGTNGDQLIARLRDNPRTMQVLPILFSDSDDELSVVDTGAVSWLHKEQGVPMLLKRLGLVRDYLLEQRTRDLLEGEKHLILLYEKVMREEEGESGRRVLLVDDERENLQFLSWILEREGGDLEGELGQLVAMGTVEERPEQSEVVELPFDVVAVTQGREAVEVALKAEQMDKPFAIALIDMRMPPGIDGLETARQLRLISREIGIVITTAHNDYTLEEMRRVLGDNFSFMEKPYNAGEVYQRVVEGCSQWSATRQNLSTHQALLGLAEGMQQEIERRRETERALEQANQTKDDFLSSMSHELRTPLTTVIGYNELLKVEPEMPSQFKGMLDSSILAGKTLLQLVNDILDMSKVRAGKLELSKLPFDLGKMLSDVTDLMKLYGSERGVTVEVEVDSTAESRLDHLWVGD
ncbi:MAG: response regulator, partial [Gammaproteobacteria bacterium]|nr:response regulator [Gammaproteobacteria bacterium]